MNAIRPARRRRGDRGFTLIELLVVIAVLAILSGVVIFNITGVTNRGHASVCATDVKSVQTAVDAYVSDNVSIADPFGSDVTSGGGVLTSSAASNIWMRLVPNYLHTIPSVGNCATSSMTISYQIDGDSSHGYLISGS